MSGAEFLLYNKDKNRVAKFDANNRFVAWQEDLANGTVLTSPENGIIALHGLDAGIYKLEETKAPAGYNKLNGDVTVEIMSSQDVDVGNEQFATVRLVNGTVAVDEIDVENNHGTELPSTGGIGTTIFYVVGGVLVLAAIILLVTKKRMSEYCGKPRINHNKTTRGRSFGACLYIDANHALCYTPIIDGRKSHENGKPYSSR